MSFLKAEAYQDDHTGYSDPLDEQAFLVNTINRIEQSSFWSSTAIIINYDDPDGWYDHVLGPIVNQSTSPLDALAGAGSCGTGKAGQPQGRCGYGPRIPLLVISPYSRVNFVDHSVTDQSSILRFIEDNWSLGRIGNGSFDALAGSIDSMFDFTDLPHTGDFLLDPVTGEPTTNAAAAAATTLSVQQSGTLASNSGGAFATYEIVQPSGAALTLTLSVGPHTAVAAHQIGIDVYQGGALLGHVTPTSTSLGDAVSNDAPALTVTPTVGAGAVTIQVFNYSSNAVSYTLTQP